MRSYGALIEIDIAVINIMTEPDSCLMLATNYAFRNLSPSAVLFPETQSGQATFNCSLITLLVVIFP
jgi:hypothetical protein